MLTVTSATAQELITEAVFSRAIAAPSCSPTVCGLGVPSRDTETRIGNAVYLGNRVALTSAHVVDRSGDSLIRISANGIPARVLAVDGGLALIRLAGDPHTASASLMPNDEVLNRVDPIVTHRYRMADGTARARLIDWPDAFISRQAFRAGQSGSGLYDSRGRLVGIVEARSGFAWGPVDIAAFMSR